VQRGHRSADVLSRLRDALLGDDLDAFEASGAPEVHEILLADVRPLHEHPGCHLASTLHEVGPEDRLIGHRAVVQQEGPRAEPVL